MAGEAEEGRCGQRRDQAEGGAIPCPDGVSGCGRNDAQRQLEGLLLLQAWRAGEADQAGWGDRPDTGRGRPVGY